MPTHLINRQVRVSAKSGLRVLQRDAATEGDAAPGGKDIVGHAAIFNSWTTLYRGKYFEWREIIRPGAFSRAIKEGQDVRSLFNHDSNFVLGRTISGTLTLSEDSIGLLSRTTPPDTQTIRDLVLAPIERGDISGMSFAFMPLISSKTTITENADGSSVMDMGGLRITSRYEGEKLIDEWEVIDTDIDDVSAVTYPAYPGTDVSMRSMPDLKSFIAEKDVPHVRKVPTPRLDAARRNLEAKSMSTRASK